MSKFNLGQQVWIIGSGENHYSNRVDELNLAFWYERIEDIRTMQDEGGICVSYKTSSGCIRDEKTLFESKNEAINHAITLLTGVLENE